MAEREQKRKSAPQRKDETVEDVPSASESGSASGEKIKAELDDLLDEIDDVLEQNAEDFVKSYIQKGGE
ncbi:MAG: ubiquitin-like protein Pup [Acidimicrobiales bacterium]